MSFTGALIRWLNQGIEGGWGVDQCKLDPQYHKLEVTAHASNHHSGLRTGGSELLHHPQLHSEL